MSGLDFESILSEAKEFYGDFSTLAHLSIEEQRSFLAEREVVLSELISLSGAYDGSDLEDMRIFYAVIGMAIEYLVRMCLARIDWGSVLKKQPRYGEAKHLLLEDVALRCAAEQGKRIREVLDFVQVQRNHFVHSPFKGVDFFRTARQIYLVIAALAHLYGFRLSPSVKRKLAQIAQDVSSGSDFSDVGLEDFVPKVEVREEALADKMRSQKGSRKDQNR